MRKFLACTIALLLAGCGVNKAVVDPFAYAPTASCLSWQPDSEAECLRDAPLFSDCNEVPDESCILSLCETLDIALINNPETQLSWAKAREAAAQYGQSQSTFFPEISAEFYHTQDRTAYLASQVEQSQNVMKEFLIINNQSTWGPRGHVAWTLLDFGQRRYTSKAARYALYYADYSHNNTLKALIEKVTLDYYSYLYEKKLLESNQADLANAEETLAAAELGLKTGVKNISDVLQARTSALLAEITLSEQYRAVNTVYSIFLENLGLPASAEIKVQKLPFVDPDSIDLEPLEDFIETAMCYRSDLLASRAELKSSEMSLKAAKRQWVPTLDYSLDIGRTYFSGGFHDDYDYTSTFSVSMPLFTGFNIRNSIRGSKARVEQAEAILDETELRVIREVTTSHYNVSIAFQTLKVAIRLLKATKEEYTVALSQYKAGVNTILDVISAQSSLFDARAKQARATQQWFSSIASLTYSSGIFSHEIGDTQ